jgi:glycosyltransferase involved in cell wall biosynthesis
MRHPRISVAIPYRKRLENLKLALDALCAQSMRRDEFEVVLGAMDYSPDLISMCAGYLDRLNIVTVVSPSPFEIPAARNLAMRNASGDVCLQMDADTFLDAHALERLDACFASDQAACVVGQVVGYGNNNDGDVDRVEQMSFAHHASRLADLTSPRSGLSDPRFSVRHAIPWAFVWTGFAALPMSHVRQHQLFFDESFRGWGVDDLEWGVRICNAGLPILLKDNLYGLHLPHPRSIATNKAAERLNFQRLVRKWPRPDVELVAAFNDIRANDLYSEFIGDMAALTQDGETTMAVARGSADGRDVLIVGARLKNGQLDLAAASLLDRPAEAEVLPLVGLALPYEDGSIKECWVLPGISLSPVFQEQLHREARRISATPPRYLSCSAKASHD